MVFSGIPFLFYFFPAVLILYFLVPKICKNGVLLLTSLVFYSWGGPSYLILMLISITAGYTSGLLLEKFDHRQPLRRVVMWAVAIIDLGFLAYFKYADFFIENFNVVTGLSIPLLRLLLPIGISFYTFQILSYTIDVYRRDVPAQRNPIDLAAYVTMFPQLIAGPIVRYSDIAVQLKSRTHTFQKTSDGIRRLIVGLSKKVLIADTFGKLIVAFRDSNEPSVLFYWIYAIAFSLQIYFDFSGYSDMAIGLGKILGFEFLENFNYPFISKSVTEFWRRWHMSLGSWFRDYVYIPLGGNRCNKPRWFFNILVVWMLTGFWHGAAWNFIFWGLMFAVLLVIEKLFLLKFMGQSRVFSRIYVLFFVLISFVIFNADGQSGYWSDIPALFGAGNLPLYSADALYYLKSFAVLFALALIGATPLPKKLYARIKSTRGGEIAVGIAEPLVLAVLLLTVVAFAVDSSFSPFLYFRF
ncbi:MAG: MBOAT family protein [Clostridia bacterium]|nr:MBOAT family protein [Clostridia bacterium]